MTVSHARTSRYSEVGGQAVLGRQNILPTPWLTERHGYDPTFPLRFPLNYVLGTLIGGLGCFPFVTGR